MNSEQHTEYYEFKEIKLLPRISPYYTLWAKR